MYGIYVCILYIYIYMHVCVTIRSGMFMFHYVPVFSYIRSYDFLQFKCKSKYVRPFC